MPRRQTATASLFPEPDDEEGDVGFRPSTQLGYSMDEAISALQKAIRRGREREAMWWAHELWPRWPGYFWRRMMTIASEDCAGDPMTVVVLHALYENAKVAAFKDGKEFQKVDGLMEAQAVLLLARSVKSREPADVRGVVQRAKEQGLKIAVPDVALDKHTGRGKMMGRTMKHFRSAGRLIAGVQGRNDYAVLRYPKHRGKQPYPDLGLPGENGAEPDIELPPTNEDD